MLYSSEQLELRETVRALFREKLTSEYLRRRSESSDASDPELKIEINKLGLSDYFSDPESGAKLSDLGIIAFEAGYGLLPEFLVEELLLKGFIAPDLAGENLTAAFYDPLPGEISLKKKIRLQFVSAADTGGAVLLFTPSAIYKAGLKNAEVEALHLLDKSLKFSEVNFKPDKIEALAASSQQAHAAFYAVTAMMLSGAARKAFDMSLEYAKTRKQFETEIGSFQAVQHHLADMYLKAEAMEALSQFACSLNITDKQLPFAAESAVRFACENGPEVAEKAIQIHGGIGFTWEHDLHLYLRRLKCQQALFSFLTADFSMESYMHMAERV